MAKVHRVVFLCVVAAAFSSVSALSDEDKETIKGFMVPLLTECGKEHDITMEDVIAAKKANDGDALNPCFYACFFKKIGVITEEGRYAPDVAKEGHKKFIHDDELVSKLDSVTDKCSSINDQTVTDGAEGCEISKLLVNCLKENKDEFSLFDD